VPLYGCWGFLQESNNPAKDENPASPPTGPRCAKDILDGKHELLRIDPFAWGSVEMRADHRRRRQAFDLSIALLAPNAHPWELSTAPRSPRRSRGGHEDHCSF
jgi:hypothetical protein